MKSSLISRITHHALRLAFYVSILLTVAWAPTPQSGEFPVTGQVTNGTPDSTVPADLPVTLHTFSVPGMEETGVYTTTLTTDGSFSFDVPTPEAEDAFMARVVYQNVAYTSDIVTIEAEQTELDLPVTIYEITESRDDIQITQLHLFINRVEDGIQIGEYHLVGNAGNRTFVGVKDAETEQQTTLNITLPDGAKSLNFDGPGLGERFIERENGFADTEPIPPGDATTRVLFSYELPYASMLPSEEGGREGMQVERAFDLPVASIVILISDEGLALEGEGIVPGSEMDTSMGTALSYTAGPLAAGETLAFRLVERAAEEQGGRGTREQGSGGVAIGLVSLAVAVAIVYWLWQSPASGPAPAQARPLVEKIAALDADFEAGDISERKYRKRRREIKQQLRSILTKQPDD